PRGVPGPDTRAEMIAARAWIQGSKGRLWLGNFAGRLPVAGSGARAGLRCASELGGYGPVSACSDVGFADNAGLFESPPRALSDHAFQNPAFSGAVRRLRADIG